MKARPLCHLHPESEEKGMPEVEEKVEDGEEKMDKNRNRLGFLEAQDDFNLLIP